MSETFGLSPSKGNGMEDTLWHTEDAPSLGLGNPLWHNDEDEDLFLDEAFQDGDPLLIVEPFSNPIQLMEKRRLRDFPRAKPSTASSGYLVVFALLATFAVVAVFVAPGEVGRSSTASDMCHVDNDRSLSTIQQSFANASSFCDESFDGECTCQSPLEPANTSSIQSSEWIQAFEEHKSSAKDLTNPIDVVFLGDSLVSSWNRHFGDDNDLDSDSQAIFEELFTTQQGGRVEGLTLGIEDDKCGNLIYRLENGEIPDHLNPKVWWIMIGTNDIVSDHCSLDALEGGILRVVDTITQLRPEAKIVLNSILPPLETSDAPIASMNRRLECFAEASGRLSYFDATAFTARDATIVSSLRSGGHHRDLTNPHDAREWGGAIVEAILDILDDDNE